jgi:hypothetical protein
MALGQEAPVSLSRVLKEETMLKKPLAIAAAAAALGMGVVSTQASAGDPVLGALLGGGIGAAIGHSAGGRDGGVVGGVLGALVGSSIAASDGYYDRGYYNDGYYAAPGPYYAPAVVYGGPAVVYRSSPRYAVRDYSYRRDIRHGYDGRDWRDYHRASRDWHR